MKKFFKYLPFLLFGLCFVLNSCSEENVNTDQTRNLGFSEMKSTEDVDLSKLRNSVATFVDSVNIASIANGSTLLDEGQASDLLAPIVEETLAILPEYGITLGELQEDFPNLDDSRIAIIGIGIISIEDGLNNLQIKSVDWDRAISCALGAIGFNSIDLLRNAAETGTRVAIRGLIKTVATRLLGPIGVAFTVAEWALCYSGFSLW